MRHVLLFVCLVLWAVPAPAETLAEARAAEAALDRAGREAIQTDLVWTGDYQSRVDGAFGPGTRRAIQAFQTGIGAEPTGVLLADERARLAEIADARRLRAGFVLHQDARLGITVGVPFGYVVAAGGAAGEQRFAARGPLEVRLRLFAAEGGAVAVAGAHRDAQAPGGVVYQVLRDRFFAVSTITGGRTAYSYGRLAGSTLKAFELSWPTEADAEVMPVAGAMFNTFAPDPGLPAAAARSAEGLRQASPDPAADAPTRLIAPAPSPAAALPGDPDRSTPPEPAGLAPPQAADAPPAAPDEAGPILGLVVDAAETLVVPTDALAACPEPRLGTVALAPLGSADGATVLARPTPGPRASFALFASELPFGRAHLLVASPDGVALAELDVPPPTLNERARGWILMPPGTPEGALLRPDGAVAGIVARIGGEMHLITPDRIMDLMEAAGAAPTRSPGLTPLTPAALATYGRGLVRVLDC